MNYEPDYDRYYDAGWLLKLAKKREFSFAIFAPFIFDTFHFIIIEPERCAKCKKLLNVHLNRSKLFCHINNFIEIIIFNRNVSFNAPPHYTLALFETNILSQTKTKCKSQKATFCIRYK